MLGFLVRAVRSHFDKEFEKEIAKPDSPYREGFLAEVESLRKAAEASRVAAEKAEERLAASQHQLFLARERLAQKEHELQLQKSFQKAHERVSRRIATHYSSRKS